MKIHPTAIIESPELLGPDCEVGPYAMIGPHVRLGARCIVQAHAVLTNHVNAGENNLFGYGAIIGAAPQDFAHSEEIHSEVSIGDNNRFREYVTIHRGTKEGTATVVGNDNYLMCGVHLGHNCRVHNRVVAANNCLLAGYVEIMDGTVLGGGTVFHQFIRVGKFCMIRGGTRFSKDVPHFLVADDRKVIGLNSIGLRRAGFSPEERKEIRRAFAAIYQSGKNVSQVLEALVPEEWGGVGREFFEFIRESKRGISGFIGGSDAAGD